MPSSDSFQTVECSARPFPQWRQELARSRLPRPLRGRFAVEVGRFLRYCEVLSVPASPATARTYLATVPLRIHRSLASQALRWFFRAARAPRRPLPPPPSGFETWWMASPAGEEAEAERSTEAWGDDDPDATGRGPPPSQH